MRVFINPTYQGTDRADGGIRRVVEAQQRYLPAHGVAITTDPNDADLIANHGAMLEERPGVPMVNHNHGLMWSEYNFGAWGDDVNRHVIESMIRAQTVTAPSRWVANAISRGMLIKPTVIHHGVDADDWRHSEQHGGYVLWNKARADLVSDPADMQAIAALLPDVHFASTFGQPTPNVHLIGALPFEQMKPLIQRAGIYLATARETFGIGTLEALASGVPVAGWRYGGQAEIILEGETGYLAEWGDDAGLAQAVMRCLAERDRLSRNARADVKERWGWKERIAQYAALYQDVLAQWRKPRPKVSVVVTAYNLDRYVGKALRSIEAQTLQDFECILVDDCSTDSTGDHMLDRWAGDNRWRYLRTPHNLKLAGARNYGWQHSTGKYVLFLDADDTLAPGALDVLSHALDQHTDIHIAYGHLDTMSDSGDNQRRNPWPGPAFDWRGQIAHLNQLPYAAMMRREVLERSGGYRTRDWRAEDAAMWTRLTSFGFRAAKVTEDATLIYRLRSNSKSRGEDSDGDWTAWYPWRLASDPRGGLAALQAGAAPNPAIVPFGAQGAPPPPLRAWPVSHHQHPAVSVIIPVGPGHARYVTDALDSVQAQTCPAWEAIVVDDSGEAVDLTAHPWARLLHIGNGHGAGEARNEGLKLARAPLVLFLDADDMLVPRAIERLLTAYVDSGGQYVYSDWLTLSDEAKWDSPAEPRTVDDYSQRAMLQGLRHAVTALVPTGWARTVGGFDEQLPVFEDWDFYCKLAVAGYCGVRLPEPLLIYRTTAGTRTKMAVRPRDNAEPETPRYTPLGEQAAHAIADRYAAYRTGEEACMACCGGNSQTVADAQSALDGMVSFMTDGAAITIPPGVGAVRLEFVGDAWGAQSYIGKASGRVYRAGRDPHDRYHDVDVRDVEYLVSLGVFRVVTIETLAAVAPAEEAVAVPLEPRASPQTQARPRGRRVP